MSGEHILDKWQEPFHALRVEISDIIVSIKDTTTRRRLASRFYRLAQPTENIGVEGTGVRLPCGASQQSLVFTPSDELLHFAEMIRRRDFDELLVEISDTTGEEDERMGKACQENADGILATAVARLVHHHAGAQA